MPGRRSASVRAVESRDAIADDASQVGSLQPAHPKNPRHPAEVGDPVASVSGSHVRKVAKSDTGSPTSRRSENRSTRRVRSSNQGRSSTAMTTGPRAARACRRSRTSLEHSSADRSGPRARGAGRPAGVEGRTGPADPGRGPGGRPDWLWLPEPDGDALGIGPGRSSTAWSCRCPPRRSGGSNADRTPGCRRTRRSGVARLPDPRCREVPRSRRVLGPAASARGSRGPCRSACSIPVASASGSHLRFPAPVTYPWVVEGPRREHAVTHNSGQRSEYGLSVDSLPWYY